MNRKILIVADKFKGSLNANSVARVIASGWSNVWPDDQIEQLPMSDGGDGFGSIMADHMNLS